MFKRPTYMLRPSTMEEDEKRRAEAKSRRVETLVEEEGLPGPEADALHAVVVDPIGYPKSHKRSRAQKETGVPGPKIEELLGMYRARFRPASCQVIDAPRPLDLPSSTQARPPRA